MRSFAALYAALDETTRTGEKVAAIRAYLAAAAPEDAAWAVYFLIGRKPRQVVGTRKLRAWVSEAAGVSEWLFDECHEAVGDLAETAALLLPPPTRTTTLPLYRWVEDRLLPLAGLDEAAQRAALREFWDELDPGERLVFHKLITGAFRVGVSQRLVIAALAELGDVAPATVAHRLMGAWQPSAAQFRGLVAAESDEPAASRPYPFLLAHPLDTEPAELGPRDAWQAEWKWDGIRAQIVRRGGQLFVWSRGEELIGERFPELAPVAGRLPEGTVLDGELLPWRGDQILPFAELQRRIGRKNLTRTILAEVPAGFLAFDLLEHGGHDIRERPLGERRRLLEQIVTPLAGDVLRLSPIVEAATWDELAALRADSRARNVEGLMLKRKAAPYGVGRVRGDWWKWKLDPLAVDAVLVYAQSGSGRRASLFTDYTFAVWEDGALVPFCKAYSGLTDAELAEVDRFVRSHTLERFGPVRAVTPELVFEIGFEGIARSRRHKSGVAVRFPRILRWRHDKSPADADHLDALRALL
ncbi:ATP-dependent DNA ligase [Nannocystis sp. SCPEA4]|uniref:ATP-dependent DNA ligase n=1 Tax=Nannocystis sp. SCPEA4 TaxID=2996787 RepID=UPI00226D7C1A|nr:ATP-dependent DNA ligase [Nannocystis sp. SCPEA4]MCY1060416.1 ATP-dependent DNA ligase [Nannocystis sp. SCPEA4]